MRDNVAKLRRLLAEAVPEQPKEPVSAEVFTIDLSPRAKAEREVTRIASWYGWQSEVVRFLDQENALGLVTLSMEQLDRLVDRMRRLEDCLREGLDPPDCAAAR